MKGKWVKWGVVGLGLVMAVRTGINVVRLAKTGDKVKQAERQLAQAQEQNKELENRLEYVKSDEFVEKEAREKLGLGKPGEVVVILPQQDTNPKSEILNSKPNWQKWWELYGLH